MGLIIQALEIHWLFYCYVAMIILTFSIALFQPQRKAVRQSLAGGNGALIGPVGRIV
jgi:hypothetical protein